MVKGSLKVNVRNGSYANARFKRACYSCLKKKKKKKHTYKKKKKKKNAHQVFLSSGKEKHCLCL